MRLRTIIRSSKKNRRIGLNLCLIRTSKAKIIKNRVQNKQHKNNNSKNRKTNINKKQIKTPKIRKNNPDKTN